MSTGRVRHVVLVDDSAVMREVFRQAFANQSDFSCTVLPNASTAHARLPQLAPDVVVLDLHLGDGQATELVDVVHKLGNIPVVLCTSASADHQDVRACMAKGTVALVPKPRVTDAASLSAFVDSLVAAVRLAGGSQTFSKATASTSASIAAALPSPRNRPFGRPLLIVIGISTGGPEALGEIIGGFSEDSPATVIVQHMPAGFTAELARSLDGKTRARVLEAADGMPLSPGHVYVAPGGLHTRIERRDRQLVLAVGEGPLVRGHRPSVDVLFESVVDTVGARVAAAIMTGLGDDGVKGLLELRRRCALTVAQAPAGCTVFGMPRVAIESGAAEVVASLDRIADVLHGRAA